MKKKFFVGIFSSLLLVDILTKYYTYLYIPKMSWSHPSFPFGGIGIFSNFFGISFSLNHVENLGAPWGIFSAYSSFLFVARLLIIASLVFYVSYFNRIKARQFPLWLIITGAVGNVIDYISYGHVIDMFHFIFWGYSYPVFNVADSMICSGIVLLILQSLFHRSEPSEMKAS